QMRLQPLAPTFIFVAIRDKDSRAVNWKGSLPLLALRSRERILLQARGLFDGVGSLAEGRCGLWLEAKQLDAFAHWPLEGLAARDQAGAADALVDHRRAHRLLEVALPLRVAAGVDQARPPHVAVDHLPVDRVVGHQLPVDALVALAEVDRRV